MLDIPVDKADDLIAASEPLYVALTREHVAYDLPLDPAIRDALAAMGPSARHGATAAGDVDATRVSVDILRLAPR
jgi:23S rRNA (guanine745-N1)-methyltransferase